MGMAKSSDLTGGTLRGVTGPLAKVSFSSGAANYVLTAGGTSSGSLTTGASTQNPDGSTNIMLLSVAAGPPNGISVALPFSGRVFGVRWRRDSSATPFFDLVIDGVAHRVEESNPRLDNVAASITDYEASWIVGGLEDKRHTARIHLPCDKAGGAARSLGLLGYVVERGRGYNEPAAKPPLGTFNGPTTMTTTATSIPTTIPLVSALHLHNKGAASQIFTLYGPDGATVMKAITIAAGADAVVQWQTPRYLGGCKWKADVGTSIDVYLETL